MRAVLIDGFGGPEVLRLGETPVREPGRGQVLIRVVCAGLNPADYKERDGAMAKLWTPAFPIIAGRDGAGVIERVGPGVTQFRPGDRVVTSSDRQTGEGALAEFVRVSQDHVGPMPRTLSFAQASTIPVAGRTAWQVLFASRNGALQPGQSVLWHGGAGGTGSFGVQFAKARGLRVAATCRTDNVEYVESLGADRVIDYRRESIREVLLAWAPGGVDVVVDAVSGGTLPEALDLLRPGGRVVQIATGTADGDIEVAKQAAQARGFTRVVSVCDFAGGPAELSEIAALIDAGQVRTPATQLFPLDAVAEAEALLAGQHVRGKLAIQVAEIDP